MAVERDPWERQKGEQPAAWQGFCHFLEGHGPVEIAKLVGVNRRSVSRWRERFRWDDRRDALEIERDRELSIKLRAKRREVSKAHVDMLQAGRALVAQAFAQLNGKDDLATLPQATRALRHIVDAERALLGMPTEVVETRQGPPIGAEELNDAAAILRDPELIAEFDRLSARAESSSRGPVAGDAGGDGRASDGGAMAPSAPPRPPEP